MRVPPLSPTRPARGVGGKPVQPPPVMRTSTAGPHPQPHLAAAHLAAAGMRLLVRV